MDKLKVWLKKHEIFIVFTANVLTIIASILAIITFCMALKGNLPLRLMSVKYSVQEEFVVRIFYYQDEFEKISKNIQRLLRKNNVYSVILQKNKQPYDKRWMNTIRYFHEEDADFANDVYKLIGDSNIYKKTNFKYSLRVIDLSKEFKTPAKGNGDRHSIEIWICDENENLTLIEGSEGVRPH
ncbi:MAG: hypothetical protein CVV21_11460 [Candidatus Goldiibacteriota bacterium HGW-Goldbacteria-1]|nr:MAG: hypothetical protein CVV21_11460 [Candidatus Goldiibacteriota bacterium HGW-Goldbacteria-1]